MSTKLNHTEADILNFVTSAMESVHGKVKKDATDLNAQSKALASVSKFYDTKYRWTKYYEKNPKAMSRATLFLT